VLELVAPPELAHVALRRGEPVGVRVGPEARKQRAHVREHAPGGAEAGDGRDALEARAAGAELEDGGAAEPEPRGVGGGEVGGEDERGVPEPGAGEHAAGGRVVRAVALDHGHGAPGHGYVQGAHFLVRAAAFVPVLSSSISPAALLLRMQCRSLISIHGS